MLTKSKMSDMKTYFTFWFYGRKINANHGMHSFKRRFKANSLQEAEEKLLSKYECKIYYRI